MKSKLNCVISAGAKTPFKNNIVDTPNPAFSLELFNYAQYVFIPLIYIVKILIGPLEKKWKGNTAEHKKDKK